MGSRGEWELAIALVYCRCLILDREIKEDLLDQTIEPALIDLQTIAIQTGWLFRVSRAVCLSPLLY